MRKTAFLTLVLLAGTAGTALAETGFVAGDSLGVGVSMVSRLQSVAKNSVSIRVSGTPIQQIEAAPAGSYVFLSLGTNDAISNIVGLEGGISRIVAAAEAAKVHLVWMGPPCVFKPWDTQANTLDGILQKSLHGTGVTYVSMRDDRLCNRSIRAPDGVHFNMTGYHAMWDKARTAAGFTAPAGEAPTVVAAAGKTPIHKASKYTKKRRRRAHRQAAAKPTPAAAPASPAAAPPPSNPQ